LFFSVDKTYRVPPSLSPPLLPKRKIRAILTDLCAAPILEPGLNEVFPEIKERTRFPKQVINMKQTPDASEFWIAGLEGKVKRVSERRGLGAGNGEIGGA